MDFSTAGGEVRLAPVGFQPMASDDVAAAVARVAVGDPLNGIRDVAGPELFRLDELVRTTLTGAGDPRVVVTDEQAHYYGARLDERTLVPGPGAELGGITLEEWRARQ